MAKKSETTAASPAPLKSGITTDIYGGVVTRTFSNGLEIVVDYDKLTPDIQRQCGIHGLNQKLGDAAAIPRNTDTGRSATLTEKYEAIKEVADRITHPTAPMWNKVRGDGESPGNGLLVRALMELKGKDRASIEAWLEPKTKEEKAALRNNEKVAAAIARLKSAQSDVDSDALLDEIPD